MREAVVSFEKVLISKVAGNLNSKVAFRVENSNIIISRLTANQIQMGLFEATLSTISLTDSTVADISNPSENGLAMNLY